MVEWFRAMVCSLVPSFLTKKTIINIMEKFQKFGTFDKFLLRVEDKDKFILANKNMPNIKFITYM